MFWCFGRWGFPGVVCWDLLGWLDRFGLLDAVSLLGLLGMVCMVKYVGSGLLGWVFLVRLAGLGITGSSLQRKYI